jgi:spore germination protein YaaH
VRSITYLDALTLASGKGIYPARGMAGERTFHYSKDGKEYAVSFQDAEAIRIKIANAKKLGVKGVALFKIDGKSDLDFWKYIR